jgi:hypothetical protein
VTRKLRRRAAGRGATPRQARLFFEQLETRDLLSASPLDSIVAHPLLVTQFQPSAVGTAYSFAQAGSTTSKTAGSGQTIAIVDAYNDPKIASDLATFDAKFGLSAPPNFKVVNQTGGSSLPATDAGWATEIALDVEWAHAMAPGANILLVEARSASLGDLLTAVNYARQASLGGAPVTTVSMSWGADEFRGETSYDSYFTTPAGHAGVTFIAASGDYSVTTWPAAAGNVLAVGGTTLNVNASGSYVGETAWRDGGGGVSLYERMPSYQTAAGIVTSNGGRAVPDVAYNADPNTGFLVYDSVPYYGSSGWFVVGGTSAGAPQWASIIAIANQARAAAGLPSLAQANAALYTIHTNAPQAFHDIASGNNGYYSAAAGFDAVTGLGSPVVSTIIADLVNAPTAGTTTTSTSSSGATPRPTTHHHATQLPWDPSHGGNTWYADTVLTAVGMSDKLPSSAPLALAADVMSAGLPRIPVDVLTAAPVANPLAAHPAASAALDLAAGSSSPLVAPQRMETMPLGADGLHTGSMAGLLREAMSSRAADMVFAMPAVEGRYAWFQPGSRAPGQLANVAGLALKTGKARDGSSAPLITAQTPMVVAAALLAWMSLNDGPAADDGQRPLQLPAWRRVTTA